MNIDLRIPDNELARKVVSYKNWRHRITLENGFTTMGYTDENLWKLSGLPEELKGKSFLDVGANDGYFSFEAEKRGAAHVTASDIYRDEKGSMREGWTSEGIELAKAYLKSKIEIVNCGVNNLPDLGKKFDVIYFGNIISWLEDIPKAIKTLTETTNETLIIHDGFLKAPDTEPLIRYERPGKPYLYKPNLRFMEVILGINGFKIDRMIPVDMFRIFHNKSVALLNCKVKAGAKIYSSPLDSAHEINDKEVKTEITSIHKDMFFAGRVGWVNKSDVQVIPPGTSGIKNIIPASMRYSLRKAMFDRNSDLTTCTLICKRK